MQPQEGADGATPPSARSPESTAPSESSSSGRAAGPGELAAQFDEVLAALDDQIHTAEFETDEAMRALAAAVTAGAAGTALSEGGAETRLEALEATMDDVAREAADLREMAELAQRHAAEWERRAMAAVNGGNDARARVALDRHNAAWERSYQATAEAESLERSLAAYRKEVEGLKGAKRG